MTLQPRLYFHIFFVSVGELGDLAGFDGEGEFEFVLRVDVVGWG